MKKEKKINENDCTRKACAAAEGGEASGAMMTPNREIRRGRRPLVDE